MPTKLSEEQIRARLKGTGQKLVKPPESAGKKMIVRCELGHDYPVTLSNFFHRHSRCPECKAVEISRRCKTPFEEVKIRAASINHKVLMSEAEYYSNSKKQPSILLECPNGHLRRLDSYRLLLATKCQSCRDWVGPGLLTQKQAEDRIAQAGYKLCSIYVNSKDVIDVACPRHGVFSTRFNDIDQGHGCRKCANMTSKQEVEIKDFIHSLVDTEVKQGIRSIIRNPLTGVAIEIDLWVPEYNLAIEHDGLYWHSEPVKEGARRKAIAKSRALHEKNLKVLAIYGDEWTNKRPIVESMIRARLNLAQRIYARRTELKKVTKEDAKRFMNEHHLKGHTQFTRAIGLYLKGELVMCITLRKSRGGIKEIARMAAKKNFVVVGGASKLVASIKGKLMSYSDNRVGSGGVYRSLGFVEITETKAPSYYYTDGKKRVFRTKCQRIKDKPGTEREQAEAGLFSHIFGHTRPVYRVYDYGHRKWLRDK